MLEIQENTSIGNYDQFYMTKAEQETIAFRTKFRLTLISNFKNLKLLDGICVAEEETLKAEGSELQRIQKTIPDTFDVPTSYNVSLNCPTFD